MFQGNLKIQSHSKKQKKIDYERLHDVIVLICIQSRIVENITAIKIIIHIF